MNARWTESKLSGETERKYNKGNKDDNETKTEQFGNYSDIEINWYGNYTLKVK